MTLNVASSFSYNVINNNKISALEGTVTDVYRVEVHDEMMRDRS